jgi:hypothetical protein
MPPMEHDINVIHFAYRNKKATIKSINSFLDSYSRYLDIHISVVTDGGGTISDIDLLHLKNKATLTHYAYSHNIGNSTMDARAILGLGSRISKCIKKTDSTYILFHEDDNFHFRPSKIIKNLNSLSKANGIISGDIKNRLTEQEVTMLEELLGYKPFIQHWSAFGGIILRKSAFFGIDAFMRLLLKKIAEKNYHYDKLLHMSLNIFPAKSIIYNASGDVSQGVFTRFGLRYDSIHGLKNL